MHSVEASHRAHRPAPPSAVPPAVRAAVESATRALGDATQAVVLVHHLWFLRLAHAHAVLPMEAPAEVVTAALAGDRQGAARLLRCWFTDALPALFAVPRPADALADALIEASALLAGCDGGPAELGRSYEVLADGGRKRAGRYYTAPGLVAAVVDRALGHWLDARIERAGDPVAAVREITVCDPACGGGAFLLAALGRLAAVLTRAGAVAPSEARAMVLARCIHGVDVDPGATAVASMALWLAGGTSGGCFTDVTRRVPAADALAGRAVPAERDALRERGIDPGSLGGTDWEAVFPEVFARPGGGFDVVLGNPPWVAFAGRSTAALAPAQRADLRGRYAGFRGFPTLHGAFLDRASAWLRTGGVLGLVLPSAMADLAGYGPARAAHTALCAPLEPLEEFGEDAFPGVVQPCFALVSLRRDAPRLGTPARWVLRERAHLGASAAVVDAPEAVRALSEHPRFPPGLFGEWGFQSAGDVARTMMARQDGPDGVFTLPLREGRDVGEFRVGPPRRYLSPDADALRRAGCRLRPAAEWATAAFVVRQTARHPIAALYGDAVAFRNSLLAGFALPGWEPALVVALLNSALLRAVHRAGQRDGRQRVFPQVKVAHLRALPAPWARDPVCERALADLTWRLRTEGRGPTEDERRALDARVCGLYGVAETEGEQEALRAFVAGR